MLEYCRSGSLAQLLDTFCTNASPLASQCDVVIVIPDRDGSFTTIQTQATTCTPTSGHVVITVSVENDLVIVNGRVALQLVLDEPTANLAPMVATQLLEEYVRGFAEHGSTVLIVEQRAKAALRISDWTYVLGGGRVVLAGAPDELDHNPVFVESFLGGSSARPS